MFKPLHLSSFVALFIAGTAVVTSLFVMTKTEAVNCEAVKAKYQCPAEKHQLHLSFDDGVADVTPKILDILKRQNIKATFLVLANRIDCNKYQQGSESYKLCAQRFETLKRIKREGHDIGSHSYDHLRFTQFPPALIQQNIDKSTQLLAPFLTTEPPVFRLPFGDGWFNQKDTPHVMQAVIDAGFFHLGWEMTAYDWNEKFHVGDKILDNVMGQMCGNGKRGRDGVVVFHDGNYENEHEGRHFTADNLERWIPSMRCAADFQPLTYFKKNLKKK